MFWILDCSGWSPFTFNEALHSLTILSVSLMSSCNHLEGFSSSLEEVPKNCQKCARLWSKPGVTVLSGLESYQGIVWFVWVIWFLTLCVASYSG